MSMERILSDLLGRFLPTWKANSTTESELNCFGPAWMNWHGPCMTFGFWVLNGEGSPSSRDMQMLTAPKWYFATGWIEPWSDSGPMKVRVPNRNRLNNAAIS